MIGIIFAVGIAIGVLAVVAIQSLAPHGEQGTQSTARHGEEQSSSETHSEYAKRATGEIVAFQQIFSLESTAEQHKELYTILDHATEAELQEWWMKSHQIERESHRKFAQQVIIGKLTTINPQEALRRCLDEVSMFQIGSCITTVFREWSILRLDEAVEAATTLQGPRQNVALQAILDTRDDLSESQQFSIAKKLNAEELFLQLVSEVNASKVIAEPEESWTTLLDDDVDDYLQTDTFIKVAEEWRKQIGFEVLSKIYGMREFRIDRDLVIAVARVDLAGALEYTQNILEKYEQETLSSIIIREWARTDALTSVGVASAVEPASFAAMLEREVGRVWSRTNPTELIENIETFSFESRLMPLELAFSKIASEDPAKAISMLSSVEDFVGNTSTILTSIVNVWAEHQPNAVTDWVLSNFAQEDPQRQSLLRGALRALALQDADRAFEIAIAQPAFNNRVLESNVIQEIVFYGDLEIAKKLLPRVRESSSKSLIYGDVARAMVDAGQTSEAMELGNDLAEFSQETYYWGVLNWWASQSPKNLYESLDSLSTGDLKSLAATQLIRANQNNPIFSDEQIKQMRTYLNTEDETLLDRLEN